MDLTTFLSNILLSMREYQRLNNITAKCVDNTQLLLNIIKMFSYSTVKAKAVYVYSGDKEANTVIFIGRHLVIELEDGTIVETSYDIFNLKDNIYFESINDFMADYNTTEKSIIQNKMDMKEFISDHLKFIKLAERINKGERLVIDEEYYHNQFKYVREHN